MLKSSWFRKIQASWRERQTLQKRSIVVGGGMSAIEPFENSNSTSLFENRHEAGEKLAQAVLAEVAQLPIEGAKRCVVYALPRGGLPIASSVARVLGCPLDVVVAKKITQPENRELAIGAVT
ncbi:phosphoribosyltransferase family protein, partial [Leptolyngbya sp. FACHB-36]|uniref:phosphoribosyltransferase family protein n=1 Tax=Leptolyngbya sp. FACHB-36 TaxID=2692808 RepID=UPI002410FA9A